LRFTRADAAALTRQRAAIVVPTQDIVAECQGPTTLFDYALSQLLDARTEAVGNAFGGIFKGSTNA